MAADRRVRAAANLDGTFHPAVRRDRPFLLMGSEAGHVPGKDGTSDESRPGMSGWKRWLTVARTERTCFTDPRVLPDSGGLPRGARWRSPARPWEPSSTCA